MHALYLVFNISCIFLGLLFATDLSRKRKVNINWFALFMSYLLISIPFVIWDVIATARGHWSFDSFYITDNYIFNLPVEEFLFFFTVPFLIISSFEWLKSKFSPDKLNLSYIELSILLILSTYLLLNGGEYSLLAVVSSLLTFYITRPLVNKYGAVFYLLVLLTYAFFIFGNSMLTSPPVVSYGEEFVSGYRFLSIPIEDFLYNYALIFMSIFVYDSISE